MTTTLQKMALEHAATLADQLSSEIINLGLKLDGKKEVSKEAEIYPLSAKAREIERWINAIKNP